MGRKEIKREHWLAQFDRQDGDVMVDETGDEYIMVDFESGTASDDDYLIGTSKVYLPERLQSDYKGS